jgi:hypothetical protein
MSLAAGRGPCSCLADERRYGFIADVEALRVNTVPGLSDEHNAQNSGKRGLIA